MTDAHYHGRTEIPYDIRGWDAGDDDFFFNFRVHNKRFTVTLSPACFHNSPSAVEKFNSVLAMMYGNGDNDDDIFEYATWIGDAFLPDFRRLAPPVVHKGKLTLSDLAAREHFQCEFSVVNEQPAVGPITLRPPEPEWPPEDDDDDIKSFPQPFPLLRPDEVEVPYDDSTRVYYIHPERVIVHGRQYFYKLFWSGPGSMDGIKKYAKIEASGLSQQELRTSRLCGIVVGASGWIRGLLYEWIDTSPDRTLTWMVDSRTPMATREKWATQIRETVAKLHDLGVVWGDVKSENVLIDKDDNAVVIDLEGGYTKGWVDADKSGKLEGDLQGLERMQDFIFNDESKLRPSADARHEDDTGAIAAPM